MADDAPTETFDAADPAAVDNANREDSRKAREDADVLRLVMRTKQGRAFMYRQLESCHIYSTPFHPGQPDVTAFALGEENVGKKLLAKLQTASVDLYVEMIKEQREEERRLDVVRRNERKAREASDPTAPLGDGPVPILPPPAGYPGGPPLPKKKKDK